MVVIDTETAEDVSTAKPLHHCLQERLVSYDKEGESSILRLEVEEEDFFARIPP